MNGGKIEKVGRILQEMVDKIIESWTQIAEQIEKSEEALRKSFEKVEEHKRLLRRAQKWYAKANNPAMIVSRRRVYHCRDKC